jgi:hypothetical protein
MRRSAISFIGAALFAVGIGAPSAIAQDSGGSTYPGPYFMGDPDAPVTFMEYADFQ